MAAISSQATVADVILLNTLLGAAQRGDRKLAITEYYAVKDELDSQAKANGFLLKPATADNIALATSVLGGAASLVNKPAAAVFSRLAPILAQMTLKAGRWQVEDERIAHALGDAQAFPRFDAMRAGLIQAGVVAMRENPELAAAFDGTLGAKLNVFSSTTKAQILSRFPELQVLALQQGANAGIEEANQQLGAVVSLLEEIRQADAQALADATWAARIEQAGAVVGVLSAVIGRSDPELGRKVEAIGGGVLKLASVARNLKLERIGGAMATLNIAAIGLEILGAFGNSGPSAEEVLLEQLQLVAKAVEELRQEMHARFDQIDAKLDQLLRTVEAGIRLIRRDLTEIKGELREAQTAIRDLSSQVARLDLTFTAMIEAAAMRQIAIHNDQCLGVTERTGQPLSFADFVSCESLLWLAARFSTDAIALAPAYTAMSDHLLDGELDRGVGENARFITTLLRDRFGLPLAGTALNPDTFASASDAYVTLMLENRWHAQRIARERGEALIALGQSGQEALNSISVVGDGKPRTVLFEALRAFVVQKRTDLEDELFAAETWARQELPPAGQALDPWGGLDQAPPAELLPALPPLSPCAGAGPKVAAWSGLAASYLPAPVQNWLIASGQALSACYQARYVDFVTFGGNGSGGTAARIELDIELRTESSFVARRRSKTSERYTVAAGNQHGGVSYAVTDWLSSSWPAISAELASADSSELLSSAELAARDTSASEALTSALAEWATFHYSGHASALRAPGAIREAALALRASIKLLRAVIRLSDEGAVLRDDVAGWLGAGLPVVGPDDLAKRFDAAAGAPDLSLHERDRLHDELAAWLDAPILDNYLAARATDVAAGLALPSALERATASLSLLADGPFELAQANSTIGFPYLTAEFATGSGPVDARWAEAVPPARWTSVGAWTLHAGAATTARVCVEPQSPEQRLLLGYADGTWAAVQAEPDLAWRCAATQATPTTIVLAELENEPPALTCEGEVVLEGTGTIDLDPEQLADAADPNGDELHVTLEPAAVRGEGEHHVTVSAIDSYGATTTCTTNVVVTGTAGAIDDADEGGAGGDGGNPAADDGGTPGEFAEEAQMAPRAAGDRDEASCACRSAGRPRERAWPALLALAAAATLARRRRDERKS